MCTNYCTMPMAMVTNNQRMNKLKHKEFLPSEIENEKIYVTISRREK